MKRFFRTLLSLVCAAVVSNAHAQTAPSAPTSPWSLALGAVHTHAK
ncbi:hypothetical protein [Pseudomonas putida]|nr:hypothetical protein [Pseudomonas putida]PNG83978.1 hypothetical protein CBL13_03826 [Pseudomonas putida]